MPALAGAGSSRTAAVGTGDAALRWAWPAAAAALLVLQLALTLTHVGWRDEWQAFQLAAHSRSWPDLVANLRFEGHPILWYAVLRAATSVSLAPGTLPAVQALVASATLVLVLARAPFSRAVRLGIGASYLVLFEYGTIARSYGLGTLLIVAAFALRGRLWGWVCLALAANVSVHFLGLALACAALWVATERPASRRGPAILVTGCAASLLVLWPAADAVPAVAFDPSLGRRLAATNLEAAALLLPFDPFSFPVRWPVWIHDPGSGLVGAFLPVVVYAALRRHRPAALIGLGLVSAILGLSLFGYPAAARHVGVAFLFVLGAEWLRAEQTGAGPSLPTRLWVGVSAGFGLVMAASALAVPFTPGRAVAAWIGERGLAGETWAVLPAFEGAALAGALGRPYLDLPHGCLARFQRWDRTALAPIDGTDLPARLADAAARAGGRLYLVAPEGGLPDALKGIRILASFPAGLSGPGTVIGRIDAPASSVGASFPPCPW